MRYLRVKEFRMSVLISACVAAITAAAGFFLIRQQAAMAGFLLAVLGCVLVIALWLAFTLYMFLRGVLQYFMTHSLRTIYRKAGA